MAKNSLHSANKSFVSHEIVLFVVFVLGAFAPSLADDAKPLPSAVIPKMLNALVNDTPRQQLAELYVQDIQSSDLANDEMYFLGEAWLIAGVPLEAAAAFTKALQDDSPHARFAESRLSMISLNAKDDIEAALQGVQTYRSHYSPEKSDIWGLFHTINSLARRYAAEGRHDQVVDTIFAELKWLDAELPHPAFHLPAMHLNSFVIEGQVPEVEEILRNVYAIQSPLHMRNEEGDSNRCLRMDDIIVLRDQAYAIGDEVRCDVEFRRDNLLRVIHDTLQRIENLPNENSDSTASSIREPA